MKILINNLKNNNLKVTPQRLIIYNYLHKNHIHPNAETIYNAIKIDNPSISLATVYKTLKSLRDSNLVQELNMGEDSFRYDIRMTPHFHIICEDCKSIIDYFSLNNTFDVLKNQIRDDTGYTLNSVQMYCYGKCQNCLNKY